MLVFFSCSKKNDAPPIIEEPATNDTTIIDPVDPPVSSTIGLFLDGWQPKIYVAPQYTEGNIASNTMTVVTVNAANVITKIPLTIFGQNANNWMSRMYNEPVFINHLTNLNPHVIRFPAGSGSDAFFWNCDKNQPPADAPAQLRKADGTYQTDNLYTYGKSEDNWRATVDDYYSVLMQSNSEGLITINYGYARYGTGPDPVAAAAHMAADWVRYDNGRTKYWEIGNENYGDWEWGYRIDVSANKDGQPEYLTGALYAKHFKVFADSMRKAAVQTGKTIYIGAVMQESPTQSWQTITTQTWNPTMIPEVKNVPDFYIGHNYITPYGENSNASTVLNSALTVPGQMISFMKSELEKNGGTVKPIILSEWNMWARDSKQQVSNTSGTFAVIVQAEALKNNFGLTTRWDLYNGWDNGNDHGLFSTGDEPGVARWSPRPSYYYMYFFQKCIGDRLVDAEVNGSIAVKAYASTYTSGQGSVALVNVSAIVQNVQVKFKNFRRGTRYYWYTLEGSNDNGEFSRKVSVNGSGPTAIAGGPADYETIKARSALTSAGIKLTVPAWSAVFVLVDSKQN
jgi:aspartate 1-decarboxylase